GPASAAPAPPAPLGVTINYVTVLTTTCEFHFTVTWGPPVKGQYQLVYSLSDTTTTHAVGGFAVVEHSQTGVVDALLLASRNDTATDHFTVYASLFGHHIDDTPK